MSIWAFLGVAILFYIFKGMGWLTEENNWVVLLPIAIFLGSGWLIYTILNFFSPDSISYSRVFSGLTIALISYPLYKLYVFLFTVPK